MSIDPVTTDANNGGSFNRYSYANNNPNKYIDPDGRSPEDWLPAGAPIVAHGKFLGAAAAYIQGALTDDKFLQNAGAQGMAENKVASVEGLVIIGSMGRGGSIRPAISNKLRPIEGAVGPHSAIKRGPDGTITNTAIYTPNPKNPSGFDEVKRVGWTLPAARTEIQMERLCRRHTCTRLVRRMFDLLNLRSCQSHECA